MELNIRVEDYITEDRMREICEEEFRKAVRRDFKCERDVLRILSNAGYEVVHKGVDEYLIGDAKSFSEVIKANVDAVLSKGLNSWDVFRMEDCWGRKDSIGYELLQEAIRDSKSQIVKNVERVIADYPYREIRESIMDAMYEVLESKLFGGKEDAGEHTEKE